MSHLKKIGHKLYWIWYLSQTIVDKIQLCHDSTNLFCISILWSSHYCEHHKLSLHFIQPLLPPFIFSQSFSIMAINYVRLGYPQPMPTSSWCVPLQKWSFSFYFSCCIYRHDLSSFQVIFDSIQDISQVISNLDATGTCSCSSNIRDSLLQNGLLCHHWNTYEAFWDLVDHHTPQWKTSFNWSSLYDRSLHWNQNDTTHTRMINLPVAPKLAALFCTMYINKQWSHSFFLFPNFPLGSSILLI